MSITFTELKKLVVKAHKISFELPNGKLVPAHYTITRIGEQVSKYIDATGKIQQHKFLVLQFLPSGTYNHRLHPEKLQKLLELAEQAFDTSTSAIKVTYQAENTIFYSIEYSDSIFKLLPDIDQSIHSENQIVKSKKSTPLIDAASGPFIPGTSCC